MIMTVRIWIGICLAALGYALAGYPFLMGLRARIRPRPIRREPITPCVTVLVAAHNEADVIERKIKNTLALDYPRELLEIVVVDDGSTDGTAEIVETFRDRSVLLERQVPRQGKSSAVNRGMTQARGDIVVLSDASADLEPGALRAASRNFADPELGALSGTVRLWDGASGVEVPAGLYWRYQERLCVWESATGSTVGVNGNLFAFRRSLFQPLPPDTINDEFTIAMSIASRGYRVIHEPSAITYDHASASMSAEVARRARINAGRFQALFDTAFLSIERPELTFRLVSHKLLRPFLPLFMIGLLVASLANAWFRGGADATGRPAASETERALTCLLVGGQLTVYGLAVVGWFGERWGRRKLRIAAVPYFFVSSNLAALMGLVRYATGRQGVAWEKRQPVSEGRSSTTPSLVDGRVGDIRSEPPPSAEGG